MVTWAMAAAADAVAMDTVVTAAMAAMAGKMTAATERDRLTPSPTAGSRGSDPRPLGPTMGGRPDRTCGERPRASRVATRPKVGPTNCEKNISPFTHGVEIIVGAERWTAMSTWGD